MKEQRFDKMFIWNSFIGCINHWQVAFVLVCQYLVYSSCVPFVDRWKECLFLYFSLLLLVQVASSIKYFV